MKLDRKRHLRKKPNDKMLLNIAAIVAVLIIVLAIGVFIGRTLTMNSGSGVHANTPSVSPGDNSNSFVLPSGMPTITPSPRPGVNATPTAVPSASPTVTATPIPTASPSPTTAPSLTPTPIATPTYYPTEPPQITPTPTPSPAVDITPDAPFYESITPLKQGDYIAPVSDYNSFTDNGPVYIDIHQSYMGSDYAYPGDTIGVKLRLYNTGPALDTVSLVTLNLSKMIAPNVFVETPINEQYYTKITMSNQGSMYKNFSYPVPMDNSIAGVYKIRIRFYVNGQLNAEAIKAFNII